MYCDAKVTCKAEGNEIQPPQGTALPLSCLSVLQIKQWTGKQIHGLTRCIITAITHGLFIFQINYPIKSAVSLFYKDSVSFIQSSNQVYLPSCSLLLGKAAATPMQATSASSHLLTTLLCKWVIEIKSLWMASHYSRAAGAFEEKHSGTTASYANNVATIITLDFFAW